MSAIDPNSHITPTPQGAVPAAASAPAAANATAAAPATGGQSAAVQNFTAAADAMAAKLNAAMATLPPGPSPTKNVLNDCIRLLTQMTAASQRIGVALANNLTFETNMQGLYTNMMSKIPIYDIAKDGKTLSGSDDKKDWVSFTNDKNQQMSIVTDRLRSYRDISSDNAKKIQSGLNQADDAQKSFTDLLSTIWDSMTQVFAKLFR